MPAKAMRGGNPRLPRRQSAVQLRQPRHSAASQSPPGAAVAAPWQFNPHRSHWLQLCGFHPSPQEGPQSRRSQQRAQGTQIAAPETRPPTIQRQQRHEHRQDQAAAIERLVLDLGDVLAEQLPGRLAQTQQVRTVLEGPLHARQQAPQRSCDTAAPADRASRPSAPRKPPTTIRRTRGSISSVASVTNVPAASAAASRTRGTSRRWRGSFPGAEPAAEHAAQHDRHRHGRQRQQQGGGHGMAGQPGQQQHQRVEQEEALPPDAGPRVAVAAGREDQAEKQQQRRRLHDPPRQNAVEPWAAIPS